MMIKDISRYLNQTCALLSSSGSNKYGESTFSSVSIRCRIEPINSFSKDSSSQVDANIYTDYKPSVSIGSRIVFGSVSYLIGRVHSFFDKDGIELYKLLEVQRGTLE